ncbi:MAG: hypothetical protein R6U65_12935 [Perlabentimonas sp.]
MDTSSELKKVSTLRQTEYSAPFSLKLAKVELKGDVVTSACAEVYFFTEQELLY